MAMFMKGNKPSEPAKPLIQKKPEVKKAPAPPVFQPKPAQTQPAAPPKVENKLPEKPKEETKPAAAPQGSMTMADRLAMFGKKNDAPAPKVAEKPKAPVAQVKANPFEKAQQPPPAAEKPKPVATIGQVKANPFEKSQ